MQKPDLNIDDYITKSPKFEKVEWLEISDNIKLKVKNLPEDVKQLGNFVTVRRLKQSKYQNLISELIVGVKKEMTGNKYFSLNFPINLKNKDYIKLYALMISEGSYTTEFSLNVPEKEFHDMFKETIENLFSKEVRDLIKIDKNKGFLRSRAPAIIRKLLPLPEHIPYIILNDKELAREYLKVAFEAEGSPIIDMTQHKRYIKLSRYTNITLQIKTEDIPEETRIYSGSIKIRYPELFKRIKDVPPETLLGEAILLKKHFNIDCTLVLEAIRKNRTDLRCGKITARWVLLIYANNIDKFISEIGFITKEKNLKLNEMKQIKGNNPQYYTLAIIKKIELNGTFYRKDFINEMKKSGYKSPSCYLWRFAKKGLIKRIKEGYYKILF